MRIASWLCCLGLGLAFACVTSDAGAAPPKPAKSAAKRKPGTKQNASAAEPDAKDAKDATAAEKAEAPAEAGESERTLKRDDKGASSTPRAIETQEKEGIKGYKFGAVEVEGRLKSPQVLYFLRRVRAEFAAGDLGHRSFLRELSHTRNDAAFR